MNYLIKLFARDLAMFFKFRYFFSSKMGSNLLLSWKLLKFTDVKDLKRLTKHSESQRELVLLWFFYHFCGVRTKCSICFFDHVFMWSFKDFVVFFIVFVQFFQSFDQISLHFVENFFNKTFRKQIFLYFDSLVLNFYICFDHYTVSNAFLQVYKPSVSVNYMFTRQI